MNYSEIFDMLNLFATMFQIAKESVGSVGNEDTHFVQEAQSEDHESDQLPISNDVIEIKRSLNKE